MKKLISLFLTFAMLFSLAMPAMAAEGDSLSTIYIDVGQLENAASVQSVWLSTLPDSKVSNERMTHVSGTIYSYDISAAVAAGDTKVLFQTFSGEGEGLLGSYYTAVFEAGKNLWTVTGNDTGTWSVYGDDGSAGLPSAPSDGGNANDTIDVTASYTPSSTEPTDPEAKWGTDADNLTEEGTLAQAIAAAEANPSITYIQLQRNVTTDNGYDIESGVFTIDLNGKTLTSSGYFISVLPSAAQVTLTDTATGGAVTTTGSGVAAVIASSGGKVVINGGSYSGEFAIYLDEGSYAEINNGTFAGTSNYAVMTELNSELNIAGGNFSGSVTAIAAKGTTTITGGSFKAGFLGQISYWGGTLDLSDYTGDDLTLSQNTGADMTVPNENIKLPEGYAFKDGKGNNVTTLANGTIYTIDAENAEPTYTITVAKDGNGTVEAPAIATKGQTVTVTLNPADGYMLLQFEVFNGEGDYEVESQTEDGKTYTFVMPAENVILSVVFCLPGTTLDTIYYKGPWTNVRFEFFNSTGLAVGVAVGTIVEDGIYSTSPIPEWTYALTIRNLDDESQYITVRSIPTDGNNMYNAETGQWETYTPSQPPEDVTSAEITWGSMSFTYDDTIPEGKTEENGWSNDGSEGAGTVTVTNTGTTTFTAQVAYKPESGYTEIEGTFDAASAELATEASKTFTLTLKNKPSKAIPAGTKIGSVTITINEAAEG